MLNAIPIVGWFISFLLNASLAVPFWLFWTVCGMGEEYFSFLPAKYHSIPFWHCVMLFVIISIIKSVAFPVVSSSSSSKE